MALTRPAWTFTVTSVSRGWTYTTTEGDPYDPDLEVQLLGELRHSWKFTDDRVPGPFDPSELTFYLGAATVHQLPHVAVGDLITARLARPLTGWPADPNAVATYFEFEGRIAEPELDLDPQRKLKAQLSIICTDGLTDLNQRIPNITEETYNWGGLWPVTENLSVLGDLNLIVPRRWLDDFIENPVGRARWTGLSSAVGASAHDLLQMTTNTEPIEYTPGERVVSYPRARYTHLPHYGDFDENWLARTADGTLPIPPRFWYWVTPILRRLGSNAGILILTWDSGPYATAQVAPDADERDGLAYLDACRVRTPLEARKAREQMVNTIVVEAWKSGPIDSPDEPMTRQVSRPNSTEFGTVTRTIPSLVYLMGLTVNERWFYLADRIAAAFMPDGSADDQPWGFDELDICTWLMDDAELDRHATEFWPAWPTGDDPEPRTLTQLVVHGVDDDVLLESTFMTGIVCGATHTITDGELLITPRLIGGVLPPHPTDTDAITAADFVADPLHEWAPWARPIDIDPALTAIDFRLIGAIV